MLLTHLIIVGHSMEPTLSVGHILLVSSIPYLIRYPKIGDIIAFKKKGKIFVKRVARIDGEKYFLKGDNEKDSFDSTKFGWIDRKEIIGKLILKI